MKHSLCPAYFALIFIACCSVSSAQMSICTRGIAVPVLKRSVFPNVKAKMSADERTSVETARTGRGDLLTVRNWGCEYYVLTFRFETSRYRHDLGDLRYWFRQAANEMAFILPGVEAPIDIKKGIAKLRAYTNSSGKGDLRRIKLGRTLMFGGDERDPNGDDIPQTVSIDSLRMLKKNRYVFEVTFAAGPL